MQVGDLVKSNYPDMQGAMGMIIETRSVAYWMSGSIQQYKIDWVDRNRQPLGVMWMTAEKLELLCR